MILRKEDIDNLEESKICESGSKKEITTTDGKNQEKAGTTEEKPKPSWRMIRGQRKLKKYLT